MHWGSLINDQEKDKFEEMEQWWKDRVVCLRVQLYMVKIVICYLKIYLRLHCSG